MDSITFGSMYFKTPILTNRQNRTSFSGNRVEIITYLLEKEGDFEIPKLKANWFDLRSNTAQEAIIESRSISVAANPDLELILTRQKELQAELAATEEVTSTQTKEPFNLYGLNWWQLILVLASIVLIVKFLIRLVVGIKFNLEQKKNRELEKVNKIEREPAPLSKLSIGLECGGSDGFSGITANPLIGVVSDKINAIGGRSILSEFPELCGVEQDLIDRCDSEYYFMYNFR